MDFEIKKCFYCGDDAATKDHIVPVSYYYSGVRKNRHFTSEYDESNLVDSCQECNCMAWNNVFQDVYAKKDYIQDKIRQRYRKVVNMPYWSDEELFELGKELRKEIEIQQLARKWILNRISYPDVLFPNVSLNYEIQRLLEKL